MKTRIIGPPGCGKTTTLSTIAREHDDPSLVGICSLTRAAAAEIGSRDTGVPEENIGTLHSMALRSLPDDMKRKVIEDDTNVLGDFSKMYPDSALSFNKGVALKNPERFQGDQSRASYDILRNMCAPRSEWPEDVVKFAGRFESFKDSRGLMDFTDIIERAIRFGDVPHKFLILDEAQDTSALEYRLFNKWADQADGAVIAGDADQSLFTWRGAAPETFMAWGDRAEVLSQSYRVPRAVYGYSEGIAGQIMKRDEREYMPVDADGSVSFYHVRMNPVEVALDLEGTTMIIAPPWYRLKGPMKYMRENAIPYHNPYTDNPVMNPLSTVPARVVRAFLGGPAWTADKLKMWLPRLTGLKYGSKRMLENMPSTADLVDAEVVEKMLGDSAYAAMDGNLEWFRSRLIPSRADRMRQVLDLAMADKENLYRTPRIIIGTVHSIKGGEADNVIVDPTVTMRWKHSLYDHGPDDMLRLFYVAATRAKKNLIFLKAGRKSANIHLVT